MKFIASFVLIVIAYGAKASTTCPDLEGKFLIGPTPYSTCVNGYEIKVSKNNQNSQVFEISHISCGTVYSSAAYVVGSTTTSGSSSAMPNATESVSCTNKELQIVQSMGGIKEKKAFSLDARGNLILAYTTSFLGVPNTKKFTYLKK